MEGSGFSVGSVLAVWSRVVARAIGRWTYLPKLWRIAERPAWPALRESFLASAFCFMVSMRLIRIEEVDQWDGENDCR